MSIFLCSDWHLLHDRDFVYAARGFSSIKEMNETIIERHNSIVKPEDEVYVLGDCGLGGGSEEALQNLYNYMRQFNGKLHIVRGNHDTDTRAALYLTLPNVMDVQWATVLNYRKYHFYLSHFPALCGNVDDKSLHKCIISLCGHSHVSDSFADWGKGRIYHVEMDAHNCYPVLLDDIIEQMKDKENIK